MKENPYENMDKAAHRIAFLIAGYIRGTITEKDHDELDKWIEENDHNMLLFEELTDEDNLEANLEWMDKVNSEHLYQQMQKSGAFKKPSKKFKISRIWIAAASVILLVGLFLIYQYAVKKKDDKNEIANSDIHLKPGGNKATLTLTDGSVIVLSDAKNGLIKKEQGSDISKLTDGELVYVADSSMGNVSAINTLTTPVGGQFQIKLSDGTKVWLNAATTLKYPTRFSGSERKVEVDGEAYFEVAKNEKQPFHVLFSDSARVTVLGTHFNVMSYKNENAKEVTLLEGNVTVSCRNKTDKLEPGMQATITGNDLVKRGGVDTEEITGWKDGQFVFHDAPIESIMRQIERWYDAKVIYQGKIKPLFNATISRSEPLSKLLHLLQLNGYVNFKIENKTIYVLP